jgi:hypothetical protein
MPAFRVVPRPGTDRFPVGLAEFCIVPSERILICGNGPFTMMRKSLAVRAGKPWGQWSRAPRAQRLSVRLSGV